MMMMMHRLYRNTSLLCSGESHMQIIVRFGGLLFSSLFLDFSSLFLIFSVCSSNQHQRKEQSSFSLLLCTLALSALFWQCLGVQLRIS